MPDQLSALTGSYREGCVGEGEPGVMLRERPGLAMVQVAAFPEDLEAATRAIGSLCGLAPPEPNRAASGEGLILLWLGPERWMVVADGRDRLARDLEAALDDLAAVAVTDLGHARTVIRVAGPRARDLLAKGCSVDLHPRAFPAGACVGTRFGHHSITLHATDADAFDVYVLRSFGRAFWEELTDLAAEFGYEVAPVLAADT